MCLLFFTNPIWGNNLQLSDLRLEDETHLSFSISWENAWNLDGGTNNHDATWIFAKIKEGAQSWQPLLFSSINTNHSFEGPDALEINPTDDGLGLFVVPTQTGSYPVAGSRITLELQTPLRDGRYAIDVFGLEMVWIPEGPFWLGDGSSNETLEAGDGSGPLQIQATSTLSIDNNSSSLAPHPSFGTTTSVPDTWPNGFAGFYAMKYEISQIQFADFLNHLTYDQQVTRTVANLEGASGQHALSTIGPFRNGLRLMTPSQAGEPALFGLDLEEDGSFNGDNEGQNRACSFLNWDDLLAYLDWAGLSPMTELEYEKACRGPLPAQAGEFAWGTPSILDANTPLLDGSAEEAVAEVPTAPEGLGSHGFDGPKGPLRCGFAAQQNSDRLSAGASYYGLMEMSGNLWELCVSISDEGTRFTGSAGDGRLSDDGHANQADWPAAAGAGHRGGGWNSGILPGFRDLAVSDRYYIDLAPDQRRNTTGGRGVRR